jgi:FHA domain
MNPRFPAETRLSGPTGTLLITAPAPEAGRHVVIGLSPTLIGRAEHCDLVLPQDNVSREHARVSVRHGEFVVEDLGSSNGTWVNGERLTGPTALRDGDGLVLGDAEIEFSSVSAAGGPRSSRPPPDWDARGGTTESETLDRGGPASLRQGLRDAPGFSLRALAMAVGGSAVSGAFTAFLTEQSWGTLAGSILGPVVTATFDNRGAAESKGVRAAAIAILTAAAFAITVAGYGVADAEKGSSVLLSGEDTTFPAPLAPRPKATTRHSGPSPTAPATGPDGSGSPSDPVVSGVGATETPSNLGCGELAVDERRDCAPAVILTSVGSRALHITGVEIVGANSGDFVAGRQCVGRFLDTADSCALTVAFQPSAAGERTATLVIHQNLPRPDTGTEVPLTGTGLPTPTPS